jgi:hypothetical protein
MPPHWSGFQGDDFLILNGCQPNMAATLWRFWPPRYTPAPILAPGPRLPAPELQQFQALHFDSVAIDNSCDFHLEVVQLL